jgi:multiple sugar transport system ATP-binding protein
MNLVQAELVRVNGDLRARFGGEQLAVEEVIVATRPALARYEGRTIVLGVRPEDLQDAALVPGAPDGRRFGALVDLREDMGADVFVHFSVAGEPPRSADVEEVATHEAVEAREERARREGVPFTARLERGTSAREGERIELVVKPERLHFFDAATGAGIYGT